MPLTGNVSRLFPGEAYVSLDGKQHKALADQIATAAKERLREKISTLGRDEMAEVGRALMIQLAL